jgi:hypothetical protein
VNAGMQECENARMQECENELRNPGYLESKNFFND